MRLDVTAAEILERAAADICELTSRVGIDGMALLSSLPESGTLLTGKQVPALTPKDQGKVSVLFYLNRTADGMTWPFIQFRTFRHGGVVEQFHGLQWLRQHANPALRLHTRPATKAIIRQTHAATGLNDADRRQRDERLQFSYRRSLPLTVALAWVRPRFAGLMTDNILARASGRHAGQGRMLFPMETITGQRTGYHQIVTGEKDEKRHFVHQAGLMSGSFVRIAAADSSSAFLPAVICEGVATALTLALVWPGPVFAALCAKNLKKVRQTIYGPVILAADNDQWKTDIGNVGLQSAREACETGDLVIAPHFSPETLENRPTDFNDLLLTNGLPELRLQLHIDCPGPERLNSAA
jgi:putative DNA primase/helicase